jgi:hypothetical protein
MKMRCAIARAFAPGIAAEGNGLAVLVAAMGITAIACFKIDQRQQPPRFLMVAVTWFMAVSSVIQN